MTTRPDPTRRAMTIRAHPDAMGSRQLLTAAEADALRARGYAVT